MKTINSQKEQKKRQSKAYLIASNLNLVSALRHSLEAMEACDGMPGQFTRIRAILQAREAIAKASFN
jgi:hypothetical protein